MDKMVGKSWPTAQFPTKVWDGKTPSRSDPEVFRPPDENDYDQLVSEIKAVETAVLPSAWVALVLSNGWTNGAQAPASYKTIGTRTYLKGVILPGTKADGTLIATLPAGVRPATTLSYSVTSSGADVQDATMKIVIAADGTIKIYGVVNAVSLDLSHVAFMTDQ